MTSRLFSLAFMCLLAFSASPLAYAAPANPANPPADTGSATTLINPLGQGTTLNSFVSNVLEVVVRAGSVVVILMLVYIGFLFATSSVNPGNKDKAREYLLWTIVGALVLLGAQAIATGIQATVQALSTG